MLWRRSMSVNYEYLSGPQGDVPISPSETLPGTRTALESIPEVKSAKKNQLKHVTFVAIQGTSPVETYEYAVDKNGKYVPYSAYAGGGLGKPYFTFLLGKGWFNHSELDNNSKYANAEEVQSAIVDGSYYE